MREEFEQWWMDFGRYLSLFATVDEEMAKAFAWEVWKAAYEKGVE